MRILHILCTNSFSGAERVALDILTLMKDENEVFYASPDGPIRDTVEKRHVNFIAADTEKISEIKRLVKELKPDIVHAHDPRMSFKCALAGIRFISQLHSNCNWLPKLCPNSIALLLVCMRAKKIICVSKSIEDEYVFKKALRRRSVVLPNIVSWSEMESKIDVTKPKKYDIIYVGRFSSEKRPSLFIELAKELSLKKPDLQAVMVGDGELLGDMRSYAEAMNAPVEFAGFRENPYQYMYESRVMAVTSEVEGFGLVAAEAMSLGVPALAFESIGGLSTVVDDTCHDLGDMTEKTFRLLSDSNFYNERSRAVLEKAEAYKDEKAYACAVAQIYDL